jgi:hypothetical protein
VYYTTTPFIERPMPIAGFFIDPGGGSSFWPILAKRVPGHLTPHGIEPSLKKNTAWPLDRAPIVRGHLGPIEGHWRPLVGVSSQSHRRNGAVMTPNFLDMVFFPLAAIGGLRRTSTNVQNFSNGGHWRSLAVIGTVTVGACT